MLVLIEQFVGLTVASVQSGMPCGKVQGLIVDPGDLSISLLCVTGVDQQYYLLPRDIRFIGDGRILVDAEEKLSDKEDLIRHRPLIDSGFSPLGRVVKTESHKRLGKVGSYSIDDTSWLVATLYVSPGLLGNPLQQNLMINRSDIVDVKNNSIIVRDLGSKEHKPLTIPLPKKAS